MLIPTQNLNKTNYKIQDCFANRQTKEDAKCNKNNELENLKFLYPIRFSYKNLMSIINQNLKII
jgi:hypothetical protein